MKKLKALLLIGLTTTLVACSSGVGMGSVIAKMPNDPNVRNLFTDIPATNNPLSNGMMIAMLKSSGSNAALEIINALGMNNINLGISGENQSVNTATMLYAFENVQKVGQNVSVYMMGDSASDKAELEQAAKAKGIKLHYIMQQ